MDWWKLFWGSFEPVDVVSGCVLLFEAFEVASYLLMVFTGILTSLLQMEWNLMQSNGWSWAS